MCVFVCSLCNSVFMFNRMKESKIGFWRNSVVGLENFLFIVGA